MLYEENRLDFILTIIENEKKLNGKTFQDSLFSVSLARPRKPFNRNHSYGTTPGYDRNNSNSGGQTPGPNFPPPPNNPSNNNIPGNNTTFSPTKPTNSGSQSGKNRFRFIDFYVILTHSILIENFLSKDLTSQNSSSSSRQIVNYEDI